MVSAAFARHSSMSFVFRAQNRTNTGYDCSTHFILFKNKVLSEQAKEKKSNLDDVVCMEMCEWKDQTMVCQ